MLSTLLSLRWLMTIASIGAGIGSLLMFWIGAVRIVRGVEVAVAGGPGKATIAAVMGATDAFIFGVVLMIFAFAIVFGFVVNLGDAARARMPPWMHLGGIAEIKRTLMEVIVLYLTVDFVTDVAEGEDHAAWTTLVMPAAIVLIAAALRLMRGPPDAT
jgi:uncharacterized membrane protein YqhA